MISSRTHAKEHRRRRRWCGNMFNMCVARVLYVCVCWRVRSCRPYCYNNRGHPCRLVRHRTRPHYRCGHAMRRCMLLPAACDIFSRARWEVHTRHQNINMSQAQSTYTQSAKVAATHSVATNPVAKSAHRWVRWFPQLRAAIYNCRHRTHKRTHNTYTHTRADVNTCKIIDKLWWKVKHSDG